MVFTRHGWVIAGRRYPVEQTDPPRSPRETLPTMYDLPSEDPEEPGLPDEFHDLQPQLLSRTLRLAGYSRDKYYTASDLNIYYTLPQPFWYKRPDWFLAIDVPRLYDQRDLRRSYVMWQEERPPHVVVEFLSPGTEAEDLGRFYDKSPRGDRQPSDVLPPIATAAPIAPSKTTVADPPSAKPPGKFIVYEQYLRVPHYIVYSRFTEQVRYFKLNGGRYEEQPLNPTNPLIWLADLEIGLGIWPGEFEDAAQAWLRWCDRQGNWLLTDTEQAQQQLRQAAENLLATGMELSQVAQVLGFSESQIAALRPPT